MQITLFLMTEKGYAVLQSILTNLNPDAIAMVIASRDSGIQNDYYEDIRATCRDAGIAFYDRKNAPAVATEYALAISWRWMIHDVPQLITLHDSLLPRYRGFAPLASALINGEQKIGVTALFAGNEYDTGDIICQRELNISYPIKIQEAIRRIIPLYTDISFFIASAIVAGRPLARTAQDESRATYSLWLDDSDYNISWGSHASQIRRFIDAVGYPYMGARSSLDGQSIIIHDAVEQPDVTIENRAPGKVIFNRDGLPVIVCGNGLLKIIQAVDQSDAPIIPLRKFRSRFY